MKTRMIISQSNNQSSHTLGLYAKYAKATHNSHSQPVPLLDQHGIANLLGNLTPHQRLHHSQCKLKAVVAPLTSDDHDDNDRLSLPLPIDSYIIFSYLPLDQTKVPCGLSLLVLSCAFISAVLPFTTTNKKDHIFHSSVAQYLSPLPYTLCT